MKHVMVDIETLGTRPGSVILSIGACRFDESGIGVARFYRPIDVFDSLMNGLTVDTTTVGWWRMQSAEARGALAPGRPLVETLGAFQAFLNAVEGSYLWAKGPDFDCVLLDAAYQATGVKRPWRYNLTRDVRTILSTAGLSPVNRDPGEVEHNALGDAVYQAKSVILAAEKIDVVLSEMV
jgi:hypothetical protein